jgi:putative polyhydroxyalkanoate system protein
MMARVNVSQDHNKTEDEVREIVNRLTDDLKSRYGISPHWQGDNLVKFKRSGVSGQLLISDNKVIVDLDISFLLSAYAGKIKSELKTMMAKKLG